jgi:hypothetical protein
MIMRAAVLPPTTEARRIAESRPAMGTQARAYSNAAVDGVTVKGKA